MEMVTTLSCEKQTFKNRKYMIYNVKKFFLFLNNWHYAQNTGSKEENKGMVQMEQRMDNCPPNDYTLSGELIKPYWTLH